MTGLDAAGHVTVYESIRPTRARRHSAVDDRETPSIGTWAVHDTM
jgi:hypothetical protein